MLFEGFGKYMVAGSIRFGAKEKIIVVFEVKGGLQHFRGWDRDRTRWQPAVDVGVVRGLRVKVLEQEPSDGEIPQSEDNGRVCPQPDALCQTIHIDSRHRRSLLKHVGLTLDQGGQNAYLYLGEAQILRLPLPLRCPETIVFLLHAIENFLGRVCPENLVGVRDEHAGKSGRLKTIASGSLLVQQKRIKVLGVEFHVSRDLAAKILDPTHGRYEQIEGLLIP